LAKVEKQFPDVGGEDLYYGGTSYKNLGGLGVQMATAADRGEPVEIAEVMLPDLVTVDDGQMLVVPTTRLYNRELTFRASEEALMRARIADPYVEINHADAARMQIADGDMVDIIVSGAALRARAHVNGGAPEGSVVVPRYLADAPAPLTIAVGEIKRVE
ncbi:MAG: hypothetical protein CUN53_14920, partial [Phototrophicales bacterium]